MYFRKGDRESSSTSREKSTSEVEILDKFMGSRNRSNSAETGMIFDNYTQGAKEEKLSRWRSRKKWKKNKIWKWSGRGRVIKKEGCTETEKGETLGFKDAPVLVPSIFFSKCASIINDVKEDELISDLGKIASRKGRRQACRWDRYLRRM